MDTATPVGADNTRTRSCDLDPATFDPQTGEFRPPAPRPARLKAAAVARVTAALAATTCQDASNDPAATLKRRGPHEQLDTRQAR